MYEIKRVLVGLDLSDMDKTLLAYSSYMAEVFQIETIYFLHVAKSLDLPKELLEKYPDLVAPSDEAIAKTIDVEIKKHFTANCEYKVEVREGSAEENILRWAKIKEIDLVVMGRKVHSKGSGVLPGKLARTAPCSILYVPENANNKISKLLVPVDFSKTSSLAFEEALLIRKSSGASIVLHNSYEVPSGYHLSGKSFEEFAEIMKGHAYKDAEKFLQRANIKATDIEIVLTLDEDDDPAGQAYKLATEKGTDFIVIGSKGRTGMAAVLLGSVADKMTRYDTDIPLLVVKDKKENLNFLQALLQI
ncbi:universal stress protein family [Fulvivirga imtechensis AK7]|uniref:Universal stress protein family n=1 Tax=Fulvivirga imtechensis AK7 TaxID=1237149 RepID=L8JR21_9BACT|nr:universal stress protein [Fulvivirga imtechensis]ELR69777.1 universal stress protein family [Fulvivirga imtechensis AK7]